MIGAWPPGRRQGAVMAGRVWVWTAMTATVMAVAVAVSAEIRFASQWKSMDAGSVSFAGKKVAALVISNDDSLRVAGEESLVRELTARGLQAVPTYRMAPKEVMRAGETAKPWFERAGIDGVIALRPVAVDTARVYTPAMWVSTSYSTFWGYYGYGWESVYVPGSSRVQTAAIVETLIFSVPRNALLWAAVTEPTAVKDLPSFVQDLVKRSVQVMHEQGLAKRIAK
jgi:hypothetical protein